MTCSSIFTKGEVTSGHSSQCWGTISSFALICIWCFNEYLQHQDCSCGIDPEQTIVATFLVITFYTVQQLGSQICFCYWTTMEEYDAVCQAVTTQALLVDSLVDS